MQLRRHAFAAGSIAFVWCCISTGVPRSAVADDRVDVTTTWYQEKRRGGQGGLTVIHPQFDVGTDIGDSVGVDLGYSADAVSGATASVYAVDAVTSATTFSDFRNEGHMGLSFRGKRSSLSIGAGAATERDYSSLSLSVSGSIDFPGKNTNIALSYTHNRDEVCDRDNGDLSPLERRALTGSDACEKSILFGEDTPGLTVWRDLRIDTSSATLTQNLSPTLVAQLGVFGQVLRGFQENPYRRVRVAGVEPQETVPDVRGRLSVMTRINKYLEITRGAIHAMVRGYSDTWGVDSLTLEMAYSQYAGSNLLMRFRGRLYQQSDARFFKDAFFYETEGPAGAYFTGDRELAPVRNIVAGAKLTYLNYDEEGGNVWGIFDQVRLNLKADVYFFDELAADRPEENAAGIGGQFLSSSQLLDAIALQFSVLMTY